FAALSRSKRATYSARRPRRQARKCSQRSHAPIELAVGASRLSGCCRGGLLKPRAESARRDSFAISQRQKGLGVRLGRLQAQLSGPEARIEQLLKRRPAAVFVVGVELLADFVGDLVRGLRGLQVVLRFFGGFYPFQIRILRFQRNQVTGLLHYGPGPVVEG